MKPSAIGRVTFLKAFRNSPLVKTTSSSVILLEPVCKIRKEENGSNGDHGREVGSSFFIASGNASKLLETIDESFNNISLAIMLFVERTSGDVHCCAEQWCNEYGSDGDRLERQHWCSLYQLPDVWDANGVCPERLRIAPVSISSSA